MNLYVKIMLNLWWVNVVLALIVIFFGRKNPRSTLIWVMCLTFLPVIGFILYLFLGQDYTKSKMFKIKEKEDKYIRNFSNSQIDSIRDGKFWYTNSKSREYDDLIEMSLKLDESFYTQDNEVKLYFSGEDKFKALIEDLKNAEKTIDMQYYIFKHDIIGKKILKILEEKAKKGVKIRFIYDAVGGRTLRKPQFKKLKKYGGRVAIFFPSIFPIINIRLNYRNHRKIVVIDDKIAYCGGFNIGDEYLGKNKRFGFWRDTHIRIKGNGVWGLKIRFLKDWNYASGDELKSISEMGKGFNSIGNSGVQIVTSGPDTTFDNIKNVMFKMINGAKKFIYIQTPYFIPDTGIMDALKTAILSGVNVNIMIPSKPDHIFVYWASYSYIGELLNMGANCYAYKKGFLHSKIMIVDDYISTVGSANMDIRSFMLNFEANAIIYDEKVNQDLKKQFFVDMIDSIQITKDLYENRTKIIKIKEAFSRLLSPIL